MAILSEEYVVKFWVTKENGFSEQQSRSFYYESKGMYKQAEAACIFALREEGKEIKIISVIYK